MDRAASLLPAGGILERPALLVNVPSIADPTVAPAGQHVFSLEVLLTPVPPPGGWPGSAEPQRWLELLAGWCEPGLPGVDRRLAGDDARTSTSATSTCPPATPPASAAGRWPPCATAIPS